jgi:hypothetical protein
LSIAVGTWFAARYQEEEGHLRVAPSFCNYFYEMVIGPSNASHAVK